MRPSDRRGKFSLRAACLLTAALMLLLLIPLPAGASPVGAPIDDSQTLTVVREFSWPEIERGEWDSLLVEGLDLSRMSDVPRFLPVETVDLFLPGKISDLEISVRTSAPHFLGPLSLLPATISEGTEVVPYGEGEGWTAYMEQRGLWQGSLGANLHLALSPISHDSVSGDTLFVDQISVDISYRSEPILSPRSSPTSGGNDLLILTSQGLMGEVQRLANWKEALGFNVRVEDVRDVAGSPVTASNLRSFIQAQHSLNSIEYLLLVGDNSTIPAWFVQMDHPLEAGYAHLASDLYYVANDNWQSSTDFSPYHDISVGRLPFSSVGEIRNYVDKLIAYEQRSWDDHYSKALFIGDQLDSTTWGSTIKDSCAPYLPGSYSLETLYASPGYPIDYNMVISALEAGAHIVNDISHGNANSLIGLTPLHVSSIDSPMPYIWFSQACHIGAFHESGSISRALLADDSNAVAMLGHSREGFFSPSNPEQGPSNLFDKAYMSHLFDDSLLLGDVLRHAKTDLIPELGGSSSEYLRWIYANLNLLGDPTLRVGGYSSLPDGSLHIDNDYELQTIATDLGWDGSGSAANPYVIRDLNFRASAAAESIYVGNTTLHLLIRDNVFAPASGQDGIVLYNAENVKIHDNRLYGRERAILAADCLDLEMSGNQIRNSGTGILLSGCEESTVMGNSIADGCLLGISLDDSHRIVLADNILSRCHGYGIQVTGEANQIHSNSFYFNNANGEMGGFETLSTGESGVGPGALADPHIQAYNVGANDWSGNYWRPQPSGAMPLGGEGQDPSPLGVDPTPSPFTFSPALDLLQGQELERNQQIDFSASPSSQVESYWVSVNGGPLTRSTATVSAASLDVPPGMNEVRMLVFAENGAFSSYTLNFEIRPMGLSVEFISPDEVYLKTNRVAMRWKGTELGNLSHYTLRLNDGDWLNLSQVTRYTTPALAQGWYQAELRAVSLDGWWASDSVAFFVDSIAPQLSITSVSEGQIITDNQINVDWTVYDPEPSSGISHFTLQIGSSTAITIDNHLARSYSMPLAEGNHRITLRAYDRAGNYQQARVNVVVDSLPPEIEFKPGHGHPYYESPMTVEWNVTDPGSKVDYVLIRINGGPWENVKGKSRHVYEDLAEGHYLVELKAVDRAGHWDIAGQGMVVSSSNAVLDFVNIYNGAFAKSSEPIEWNVWDRRGHAYDYSYSIDFWPRVSTGSVSQIDPALIGLSDGSHSITVYAENLQTGATLQRSCQFFLRSSAPTTAWTSPSNGESSVLFDQPLRAGFLLPDLIDRDRSQITLLDAEGVPVDGVTVWDEDGSMRFIPFLSLDHPSQYSMLVKVVDKAGNERIVPVQFQTRELTLPGAVADLWAEVDMNWDSPKCSLHWLPPSDDGGYPVDSGAYVYKIYRARVSFDGEFGVDPILDEEFRLLTTTSELSYLDLDVGWEDVFLYYVTAVSPLGEGPPSEIMPMGLPVEPSTWDKFVLMMEHAGALIGDAWDSFAESVVNAWDGLVEFLVDTSDWIVENFLGFVDWLVDAIVSSWDWLVGAFYATIDWFADGINAIWEWMLDTSRSSTSSLVVFSLVSWDWVIDGAYVLWDLILDFFNWLGFIVITFIDWLARTTMEVTLRQVEGIIIALDSIIQGSIASLDFTTHALGAILAWIGWALIDIVIFILQLIVQLLAWILSAIGWLLLSILDFFLSLPLMDQLALIFIILSAYILYRLVLPILPEPDEEKKAARREKVDSIKKRVQDWRAEKTQSLEEWIAERDWDYVDYEEEEEEEYLEEIWEPRERPPEPEPIDMEFKIRVPPPVEEAVYRGTNPKFTINAAMLEQYGLLVKEQMTELEYAYDRGKIDWMEYEESMNKLSNRLSMIGLASFYHRVDEDISR